LAGKKIPSGLLDGRAVLANNEYPFERKKGSASVVEIVSGSS
jgi:hypothetical protein